MPNSRSSGGSTLLDEFTGVTLSRSGGDFGFAAIGKIRAAAQFDTLMVSATGRHDGVLVVYEAPTPAVGQVQATQALAYTSTGNVILEDIARHPAGGYYMVGSFTGTASSWPGMPSATGDDGFLMRTDEAGTILWVIPLSGTNLQELNSVAVGAGGEAYVLGTTRNFSATFGTETLSNTSALNAVFARVEDTGTVSWAYSLGGSMGDELMGLDTDVDNNVLLGVFSSTGFDWGGTLIGAGATVARVNPATGLPTWTSTGGVARGAGLSAAGRDAVVFVNFTGSTTVGGVEVNSRGMSDCVLVRIGEP